LKKTLFWNCTKKTIWTITTIPGKMKVSKKLIWKKMAINPSYFLM